MACRDHFRLAICLSAIINLLYLSPTIYMMQVYDRAVPTGGVTTLLWLTVVVAFALATLSLLDALRARVMLRASLRLDNKLAATILNYMMAQPSSSATRTASQAAMREFDQVRAAIAGTPALAMFDIVWTPIYILVAFLVHPLIGALALLASITMLGVATASERANRHSSAAALQATAAAYTAQERLSQRSELVRAMGMRRAVIHRLVNERQRALSLATQQQFENGRFAALTKFIRLFLQSVALGLGAWLAIGNQISAGSIIASSVLLSRALQPIELLVASWANIGQARQAVASLGKLLSGHENNALDTAQQFVLPPPRGSLSVRGVTVESPIAGSKALLSDIGFDVEPGEFIGIIGPSGAGKTTLARVLSGALVADQGIVRIDGSAMHDWDPEQLAQHIGYVPQDAGLLPGTIAENIARFAMSRGEDAEVVSRKVLAAASNAGVHDLIVALPGGYDRRIGWGDEELSTGQRRRVALARALYGDPALLVFDEPNAGLDADGEAALARAIAGARARGATVLMVTHSAAILDGASRLLLLVNGRTSMFGEYRGVLAALQRTAVKPALANAEVG
jgi:ATP-binding cassette subfamily C protein